MGLVKQIPEGSNYVHGLSDIGTMTNATPNSFEVSNIKISDVKAVLGEDTNSVSQLCQSPKINQWALFRPSGNPPYSLGDFGGYNHGALPPTHYYSESATQIAGMWNNGKKTVSVLLARGERKPTISNPQGAWNFVRVRITLHDTLNGGETLTEYSEVKAVAKSGYTTFNITFNSENITRSGFFTVDADYMAGDEVTRLGSIEDSFTSKNFTIRREATIINHTVCNVQYEGAYSYYQDINGNISNFGVFSLKTDDLDNPNFAITTQYPATYPDSLQNPTLKYFTGVVYLKWSNFYYRVQIKKHDSGAYFDIYQVSEDSEYIYEVTSVSVRNALPTDASEL